MMRLDISSDENGGDAVVWGLLVPAAARLAPTSARRLFSLSLESNSTSSKASGPEGAR